MRPLPLSGSRRCAAFVAVLSALAAIFAGACNAGLANSEARARSRETTSVAAAAAAPAAPAATVAWIWAGALQPTSVAITARLAHLDSETYVELVVTEDASLAAESAIDPPARGAARRVAATRVAADSTLLEFHVDGLVPSRVYSYAIELDGRLSSRPSGRFTTPAAGPFSFTMALGGCAETASRHPVFDEIRQHQPLFFLHLGDFHYENIDSRDADLYRRAYDRVLVSPRQAELYRSTPVVYVWDDHDFAGDNSDGTARGRAVARQVYREVVPHYPLAGGDGDAPIHHSFVIGRVLFVVTDSRSDRVPRRREDGPHKTMLGASQKQWLFERLAEAPRHGLVVWVNTLPWIAPARSTADDWGGYAQERGEIASYIDERAIDNLIMVSGDAHMLAIDDGTNNRFGSDDGPGFPVLQAAALDRGGSIKGGPYSEGTYPGGGQYALMRVDDDGGDVIRVSWSGRRHGHGEVVAHSFEVKVPPPAATP